MNLTIQLALEQGKNLHPREHSELETQLLLSHAIGKSRSYLFAYNDELLSHQQQILFLSYLDRASKGEPIAYIIGYKGFWDLNLRVTPAVLIPRPDTECLVEAITDLLSAESKAVVLDLGTGSGAIALAIKSALPSTKVFGLDFSFDALMVCQENARSNALKLPIINSSWLDAIKPGAIDIIVSNPPYIDPSDKHLESLTYEPRSALIAEDKGLADYRRICLQAYSALSPEGFIMFEHGYQQADAVQEILSSSGFINLQTRQDYGKNDRVTIGFKEVKYVR